MVRRRVVGSGARPAASAAFTLVELLVAMAVLVLMVIFIGSLVNGTQRTADLGLRQMSADAQAHTVFDRMADDFHRMVKRKDVDYLFSQAGSTANDGMFFFSQAPGQVDDSNSAPHDLTSLVGYRINSSFQLERLGKLLAWDGSPAAQANGTGGAPGGLVFLTYGGGTTPLAASTIAGIWGSGSSNNVLGTAPGFADGTDADYRVLASDVFRFAFCFIENQTNQATGAVTSTYVYPPAPALPHPNAYPFDYTVTSGGVTTSVHVTAIVVALGVLDSTSRKVGPITTQTVSALPKPGVPPMLVSGGPSNGVPSGWAYQLTNNFASASGLPQAAAGQVRVYQRTFSLDLPANSPSP